MSNAKNTARAPTQPDTDDEPLTLERVDGSASAHLYRNWRWDLPLHTSSPTPSGSVGRPTRVSNLLPFRQPQAPPPTELLHAQPVFAVPKDSHAWLTTHEAAAYLRLGNASSVRSAIARGLLKPDGQNGQRGTYLFRTETLDAYATAWVKENRHDETEDRSDPLSGRLPACQRPAPGTARGGTDAGWQAGQPHPRPARNDERHGSGEAGAGVQGRGRGGAASGRATSSENSGFDRDRFRLLLAQDKDKDA